MLARIERKVLDEGKNHLQAETALARQAIIWSNLSGRGEFYANFNRRVVERLQRDGVEAEVYTLQGDMGSGSEVSVDYVRVLRRDGQNSEVPRRALGGYQRYIVLDSAESSNNKVTEE